MGPALFDRLPASEKSGTLDDFTADLTADLEPAPVPAAARPSPLQPIAVGSTLRGRYKLEEELSQGGTAIVFRARDLRRQAQTGTDQFVALKILRPELSAKPNSVERLKREFRHAVSLTHPNIVRVLDLESDAANRWFLTLELLEGQSLSELLHRQDAEDMSLEQTQDILKACAAALAFAHDRGVVHGDFKPGNVFIVQSRRPLQDRVKVLDFGTAINESPEAGDHLPAATLCYASPEVLDRQRPERRDDIFSFACVAYELIGRRHPFGRCSSAAARARNLLPPRLWGLTDRQWFPLEAALSFRRERRPAGIRPLIDELFSAQLAHAAFPVLDDLPSIQVSANERLFQIAPEFDEQPVEVAAPAAIVRPSSSLPRWIAAVATLALIGALAYSRFEPSPGARESTQTPAPNSILEPAAATPAPISVKKVNAAGAAATNNLQEVQFPVQPQPAASISFDTESLSVSESAGAAVLTLRRENQLEGNSRVHWRSVPGTAQPGQDYVADAYGTVYFAEGQGQRAIYIPLLHDSIVEPTEQFTVEIYEPSEDTQLGPISRVTITIHDDD